MRKKLSSVFYMWFAFGLGIISVLVMFAPFMTNEYGDVTSANGFFWNDGPTNGAWPVFVGFMLILVSAIASGVIALPFIQISEKLEKIILISSISAFVVGAIMIGLLPVMYSSLNGAKVGFELSDFTLLGGWYVSLITAVAAAVFNVIALKLDW